MWEELTLLSLCVDLVFGCLHPPPPSGMMATGGLITLHSQHMDDNWSRLAAAAAEAEEASETGSQVTQLCDDEQAQVVLQQPPTGADMRLTGPDTKGASRRTISCVHFRCYCCMSSITFRAMSIIPWAWCMDYPSTLIHEWHGTCRGAINRSNLKETSRETLLRLYGRLEQ